MKDIFLKLAYFGNNSTNMLNKLWKTNLLTG